MKKKYNTYSKEFKLEAIRLAEQPDKSVTDVARELGIRMNQIYKWKQQLGVKEIDAVVGLGNDEIQRLDENAEIDRLKRELSQMRDENEMLKKAAAYFARELT